MKICLINSNLSKKGSYTDIGMVDFQIGLLSLAAVLEKNGHTVELFDLLWLVKQRKIEIGKSFSLNAARLITQQSIDILGFNTRCDTYPIVLNIAKRCKELNPNSIIILGGPQATFTDIETLKTFPFVDIIVRGEGELTLLDLMHCLKEDRSLNSVPGITYRDNGNIIQNSPRELIRDLDSLPLPAYHLMDGYMRSGDRFLFKNSIIYIHVGRGCPYKCKFCISSLMDRNYNRLRNPENIIKEIVFLNKKYKINKFVFGHDHLLANKKYVEKICNILLRERIDIRWICSSKLDDIDSQLLKIMSRSGCRRICLGIESVSPRIQKSIYKKINISLVYNIIKECEKYNISIALSFIIGFPEEREEDVNTTLKFILKYSAFRNCYIQLHLLAPMAGTPLFKENKKRLILAGFRSDMCDGPMVEIKENVDLIKKYPTLFSAFYMIRPRYIRLTILYEIITVFLRLIYVYPISSYIVTNELRLSPFKLLQKLKIWIREKSLESNRSSAILSHSKGIRYYPSFLRYIYKQNKIPFDLFKYIVKIEREQYKRNLQDSKKVIQYIKEMHPKKSYTLLKEISECQSNYMSIG